MRPARGSAQHSAVQLLDLRAVGCARPCSLMEGCGHWFMSSQLDHTLLCALISSWHISGFTLLDFIGEISLSGACHAWSKTFSFSFFKKKNVYRHQEILISELSKCLLHHAVKLKKNKKTLCNLSWGTFTRLLFAMSMFLKVLLPSLKVYHRYFSADSWQLLCANVNIVASVRKHTQENYDLVLHFQRVSLYIMAHGSGSFSFLRPATFQLFWYSLIDLVIFVLSHNKHFFFTTENLYCPLCTHACSVPNGVHNVVQHLLAEKHIN